MNNPAVGEIVTSRHLTHRSAINSSQSAFVTPRQCEREEGGRKEQREREGDKEEGIETYVDEDEDRIRKGGG